MSQSQTESWVQIKVEPAELKELMRRQDARPFVISRFISCFAGLACLTVALWGHWSAAIALFAYSTLYSTGAQSREHEAGHGTAFRTKWLNRLFRDHQLHGGARDLSSHAQPRRPSQTHHHRRTRSRDRDAGLPDRRACDEHLHDNAHAERTPAHRHSFLRRSVGTGSRAQPHRTAGGAAKARLWLVVMAATAGLALYLGSWLPVLLLRPVPTMIGGPIKQLSRCRMSGWPATCSTTG